MKKSLKLIASLCCLAFGASVRGQSLTFDSLKMMAYRQLADEIMADDEDWGDDEKQNFDSTLKKIMEQPCTDCDSGIAGALAAHRVKTWQLFDMEGLSDTYKSLLLRECGVTVVDYTYDSLYTYEYARYYNLATKALIKQKYGWNIFQKLFSKAQNADGNGRGNRSPVYAGGDMELQKFIYCRLDTLVLRDAEKRNGPSYRVSLFVNAGGAVDSFHVDPGGGKMIREVIDIEKLESDTSIKVRGRRPTTEEIEKYKKRAELDNKCRAEIRRVVELLPTLLPATKDGLPVSGIKYIYIYYSLWTIQNMGCK